MSGAEGTRPRNPSSRARRRWLLFSLAVPLAVILGTPTVLSMAARQRVAGLFEELLGVGGEVDGISFSYFSGIVTGPGSFRASDDSVRIRWQGLKSDLSSWELIGSTTPGLLDVVGLEVECALEPCLDRWSRASFATLPLSRIQARGTVRVTGGREPLEFSKVSFLTERGESSDLWSIDVTSRVALGKPQHGLGCWLSLRTWSSPGDQSEFKLGLRRIRGSLALSTVTETEDPVPTIDFDDGSLVMHLQGAYWAHGGSWKEWLASSDGVLGIRASSIASRQTRMDELQLRATIEAGKTHVELYPATLNGGAVAGRGEVDLRQGTWEAGLQASSVATSPELVYLLARISPVFVLAQRAPDATDCRVGGHVDLRGAYDGETALSGTGALQVSEGTLEAPGELIPLLRLIRGGTGERVLRFGAYEQPLVISADRVECSGFRWPAAGTPVDVRGHTTLGGELAHEFRLDPDVARRLMTETNRPDWARSLVELLARDALRLEGTVSEPRLRLPTFPAGSNPLRRLFPGEGSRRP